MSKTRNNTNTALAGDGNFTGPIERTNNMVTIAVTALTSRNATLTIRQYATEGVAASLISTFVMVGGSTYFCGQPVVLPFFNVTLTDNASQLHQFTTLNTVLYPNNVNDHKLQFVNTQTQHMLIQGSRGNLCNGITLQTGNVSTGDDASTSFNCSTFGNNSVLCYEDNERTSQEGIIVQASTTETGNAEWVVIGSLTVFVPSTGDKRYSYAGIRLAAFKRVRIFNVGAATKTGCVCSIYSS